MAEATERNTNIRELPPYRAVLAVDMKDFSGAAPAKHRDLTEQIPLVVTRAFARVGAEQVWAERCFPSDRGDGFVVGFRPEILPLLVGAFLDGLQSELADHNALRLAGDSRIRMRVSLTVGPLADSGDGRLGDGSGAAIVEAQRLLDSQPVRTLLDESNPDVTFVAAILSERVYQDVIEGGYATRAPSEFVRVPVKVKRHEGPAYLCVPKPSGRLLTGGVGTPDEDTGGTEPVAGPVTTRPAAVDHMNVVSGTVHGRVTQSRDIIQHGSGGIVIGGNAQNGVAHSDRKRDRKKR